jgi:hypothetical protein
MKTTHVLEPLFLESIGQRKGRKEKEKGKGKVHKGVVCLI